MTMEQYLKAMKQKSDGHSQSFFFALSVALIFSTIDCSMLITRHIIFRDQSAACWRQELRY